MSRLPIPGSDDNAWGTILNDFLTVSLNNNGTIKSGSVGDAQITDVTQAKITGLAAALSAKADDSAVIHNTSNESISGVKTFVLSPTVPAPTNLTDAANRTYVDTQVAAVNAQVANKIDEDTALALSVAL